MLLKSSFAWVMASFAAVKAKRDPRELDLKSTLNFIEFKLNSPGPFPLLTKPATLDGMLAYSESIRVYIKRTMFLNDISRYKHFKSVTLALQSC